MDTEENAEARECEGATEYEVRGTKASTIRQVGCDETDG